MGTKSGVRSAKQKAALRKAQLASARKRKGRGKTPVRKNRVRAVAAASRSNIRRRGAAPKARTSAKTNVKSRNRKVAKRTAIAVGAIGAVAGAGYVYKKREKLIVAPSAEFAAVYFANKRAKLNGRGLTKAEKHAVRMKERADHASRSTYRVREYLEARNTAEKAFRKLHVSSLRPDRENGLYNVMNKLAPGALTKAGARKLFVDYRRDVYSRAVQRHARMVGKKRRFNYNSGKAITINNKGVAKRNWY